MGHLSADLVTSLSADLDVVLAGAREDLKELVRIPSVSAPAFDQRQVAASARRVAELLSGAGLPWVDIRQASRADGTPGAPAVIGCRPAPPGAPTVMLYAHHDVQPPGEDSGWTSPPFCPTERDGRLYGRGASDDKAGVMTHVAALRTLLPRWGGSDGVGLVVFVEGEEEIGSPAMTNFLSEYHDLLRSDVIVVADSDNWTPDTPSLTVTLRGLVDAEVTVRTLDHPVHSGMYGGAAPDATTVMIQLLNRLWNADGGLALPDLGGDDQSPSADRWAGLDYTEDTLRRDAGVKEKARLFGTGSLLSRIWSKPSITVTGLDIPRVEHASNTLQAFMRAKLSMRVPPGMAPDTLFSAVQSFLKDDPPFGAEVRVTCDGTGNPFVARTGGAVYDVARRALSTAWEGADVVEQGVGGSIPFISEFVATFPHATVLVTGVEDHDSRAHGYDESQHLGVFQRAALAEVLLLAGLAQPGGP